MTVHAFQLTFKSDLMNNFDIMFPMLFIHAMSNMICDPVITDIRHVSHMINYLPYDLI